jgi:hypothetical protein
VDEQKIKALRSFENCAALFQHYSQMDLKVRRAQLHGGGVIAEPVDFCADFVLKAKRALGDGAQYEMALRLSEAGDYNLVPEYTRQRVGKTFLEYGLETVYAALFDSAMRNKEKAFAEEAMISDELSAEQLDGIFNTPEAEIDYLGENAA